MYKVKYLLDNNIYAIKKVKLHLGGSETLHEHKVYREIQAITKLEPKNIIRYYTCWIEELDGKDLKQEEILVKKFKKNLEIKRAKALKQREQKEQRKQSEQRAESRESEESRKGG